MNWPLRRLKDVADVVNGFPFASDAFGDAGDLPLVRIRDILGRHFETFVDREQAPDAAMIRNDDVVIGMDGDFNSVLWARGPAALNQRLCLVRAHEAVEARFLAYALPRHLKKINDLTYSTTVKHLSSKDVADLRIPIPTYGCQRAIADYLDRETAQTDALIAKQEQLIETLRERKRSVVAEAVTRGINSASRMRATHIPWLGSIPAHWSIKPLWSMYERVKDINHPDEQMLSVFREYGVVVKADHDNINKTAENRGIYQLVHPGWLAANRMKAWQGSVGISQHRGIMSGHYICFAPHHGEDNEYLNALFRSAPYAAGYGYISRGVRIGQAEIDNDDYRLLPVILPPVPEQREIAQFLAQQTTTIESLITKAERFIALARERRAALITAAVTGQIDVAA